MAALIALFFSSLFAKVETDPFSLDPLLLEHWANQSCLYGLGFPLNPKKEISPIEKGIFFLIGSKPKTSLLFLWKKKFSLKMEEDVNHLKSDPGGVLGGIE